MEQESISQHCETVNRRNTCRSHLAVQIILIGYAFVANNKYQFPLDYNKISHVHFSKINKIACNDEDKHSFTQ